MTTINHQFLQGNYASWPQENEFNDLTTQSYTIREFGLGNTPSEPIFVPRGINSEESDGFILTVVYNRQKDTSDLYILDAMNISQEPLAIVQLPHRIPNGFHGNWYNNPRYL